MLACVVWGQEQPLGGERVCGVKQNVFGLILARQRFVSDFAFMAGTLTTKREVKGWLHVDQRGQKRAACVSGLGVLVANERWRPNVQDWRCPTGGLALAPHSRCNNAGQRRPSQLLSSLFR